MTLVGKELNVLDKIIKKICMYYGYIMDYVNCYLFKKLVFINLP